MNIEPMIQAVRQAILLCQEVQQTALRSIDKTTGEEIEPVTIADYGSQAILCRALQRHFPDDGVIAEESGGLFQTLVSPEQRTLILSLLTTLLDLNVTQDNIIEWLDHGYSRSVERVWTIDPIDGTKGFVGLRHYAIGIGCIEKGKLAGGIMGCPHYGQDIDSIEQSPRIYYVQDGKAWYMPLEAGEPVQVQVSNRTNPQDVRIVQSYVEEHGDKKRKTQTYEKSGFAHSQVYELDSMEKYALIASGHADLCIHIPLKFSPWRVWDHAPGTALVEAAGGKVTGLQGEPLDFSKGATIPCEGVIISNGAIHDTVVAAVQEVLKAQD